MKSTAALLILTLLLGCAARPVGDTIVVSGEAAQVEEPQAPEEYPEGTEQDTSQLLYLELAGDGAIPNDLCMERNLDDKVIFLWSTFCGACKIALPRLQEAQEETGTEVMYVDLSTEEGRQMMDQLKILPRYTPTTLFGCKVVLSVKTRDQYKELLNEFKEKQDG